MQNQPCFSSSKSSRLLYRFGVGIDIAKKLEKKVLMLFMFLPELLPLQVMYFAREL